MFEPVRFGKKHLFDIDQRQGLIRCMPEHAYSIEDLLDLVSEAENGKTPKRDGSILSDDYRKKATQQPEEMRAPLIPDEAYSG